MLSLNVRGIRSPKKRKFRRLFTKNSETESSHHLQLNLSTMFCSKKMVNWIGRKYIAYHIVLLWTQNRVNFNTNFLTDVLQQISFLVKLE